MKLSYDRISIIIGHCKKIQRYSSSSATNSDNLSTNDKAAEITKALFPRWKLFTALASPCIVGIVWGITILNNKYLKEKTEEVFPFFVELVRKYYGFEAENLEESNRIKQTLLSQNLDYKVTVKRQGSMILEAVVTGSEKINEMKINENTILNDFDSIDISLIANESETDDLMHDNGFPDSDKSNQDSSRSATYAYYRSIWNINTPDHEFIQGNQLSSQDVDGIVAASSDFGLLIPFYRKQWLMRRFHNTVLELSINFNKFYALTSKDFCYLPKPHSRSTQRIGSQRHQPSTSDQIEEIKLMIAALQHSINQLEIEKRTGHRSIDSIDNDISIKKHEIAQLRRKYLNWFYFF